MTTLSIRDLNSSGNSAIAFSTSFSNSARERRGRRATGRSSSDPEEPPEVLGRDARDFLDGDALHLGEAGGRAREVARLVRLAAEGRRSEVRGVRLDEHRRERERGGGLAHVVGRLEREHSREAHEVAERERELPRRNVRAEGVEDAARRLGRAGVFLFEDRKEIRLAEPVVEKDGEVPLLREAQLRGDDALLDVARRVVVVVVEADLPHRDDFCLLYTSPSPRD